MISRNPKDRKHPRNKGINTVWFNGMSAEDKESFKDSLLAASIVRARLKEVLADKYNSRNEEYDIVSPDYAIRTAFAAGYRKAIEEIYDLIPTDQ